MDLNRLMQQAQSAALKMQEAQQELAETVIEGSAGGGMVTVHVTGAKEVQSISIAPEAVDPDDVEMLEDMILAALQDAMNTADQISSEKLGPITGGMNIPGLTP